MIPWICFFICYIWAGITACVIANDVTEGEITIPVLIILLLFWWYLPIHILFYKALTIYANWRISRRNKEILRQDSERL